MVPVEPAGNSVLGHPFLPAESDLFKEEIPQYTINFQSPRFQPRAAAKSEMGGIAFSPAGAIEKRSHPRFTIVYDYRFQIRYRPCHQFPLRKCRENHESEQVRLRYGDRP